MADEIKPGDVVQLKSGGPPMTVTNVGKTQFSEQESAWCSWFEGKKSFNETFAVVALMKVPAGEAPVMGRR